MLARSLVSALLALVPMVIGYAVWQFFTEDEQTGSTWIEPASGERLAQGKALYDVYCASCHGVNLEGQASWRQRMANGRLPAPPHDVSGHTWHHTDSQLVEMIEIGFVGGVNAPEGYQSDMPAFGKVLSEEQIALILAYIKSVWPQEALEAQREITSNR